MACILPGLNGLRERRDFTEEHGLFDVTPLPVPNIQAAAQAAFQKALPLLIWPRFMVIVSRHPLRVGGSTKSSANRFEPGRDRYHASTNRLEKHGILRLFRLFLLV